MKTNLIQAEDMGNWILVDLGELEKLDIINAGYVVILTKTMFRLNLA